MKKDNFEDILRERLYSSEMKPKAELWASIEASLPLSNAAPIKKRGWLGRSFMAASIAAALLLSLWVINIPKDDVDNNTISEQSAVNKDIEQINNAIDNTMSITSINSDVNNIATIVDKNVNSKKTHQVVNNSVYNSTKDVNNTKSVPINDLTQPSDNNVVSSNDEDTTTNVNSSNKSRLSVNKTTTAPKDKEIRRPNRVKTGIQLTLHSNGNIGSSTDVQMKAGGMSRLQAMGHNMMANDFLQASYGGLKEDWSHRFPVTVGVSVRKMFTRHIGLESGLNYTYLYSEGKVRVADSDIEGTQSLHYIGIPLSLVYRIVDHRSFDVYAKAGIAVDKLVSSDYRIRYKTGDVIPTSQSKGVQWSASLQAGATYHINKWLGLYIEPSVNHYFSSNEPNSYRTENDFSFSAMIGLRFSL